jgi:hypothetical protein
MLGFQDVYGVNPNPMLAILGATAYTAGVYIVFMPAILITIKDDPLVQTSLG